MNRIEKRYHIKPNNKTKTEIVNSLTEYGFEVFQSYPCGNVYYTRLDDYPFPKSHREGLRYRSYYFAPSQRILSKNILAGQYEIKARNEKTSEVNKTTFDIEYQPKISIDEVEYIQIGMVFYERTRLKKGAVEITLDQDLRIYVCLFDNHNTPILAHHYEHELIVETKCVDGWKIVENYINEICPAIESFSCKFNLVAEHYMHNYIVLVNEKNHLAKIPLKKNEVEKKINYTNISWLNVSKILESEYEQTLNDFIITKRKTKEHFCTRNHYVINDKQERITYLELSGTLFMKKVKGESESANDGTLSRKESLAMLNYSNFDTLFSELHGTESKCRYLGYADRLKVNLFIESTITGNIYGVSVDSTKAQCGTVLNQIEIEYNHTIGNLSIESASCALLPEINEISKGTKKILFLHSISFSEEPVVKFDWMYMLQNLV
jgi:hypothetical protein